MANILGNVLKFGAGKQQKKYEEIVRDVNNLEPSIQKMSNPELAAKTFEFKKRYEESKDLDSLLVESFAVCREAAKRTIGMRHFDVQIMGGAVFMMERSQK